MRLVDPVADRPAGCTPRPRRADRPRAASSVRGALALPLLVLALAGASCADESPRCKRPLTLDFRHRPTRAELGYGPGESTASLTCETVATSILLPTRTVALASSGYASSSLNPAGAPDTVYLNSPSLTIDEAASLARRLAVSLRLTPISAIETWRVRMAVVPAADVQEMHSTFLAHRDELVGISLQVRGRVDGGGEGKRTAQVQLAFLWHGVLEPATGTG
jgi:hypothetical protein